MVALPTSPQTPPIPAVPISEPGGRISPEWWRWLSRVFNVQQTQNTAIAAAPPFTRLGLAAGGTDADLSGTGGASQVLRQQSAGAAVTVGRLAASDLSNGTTGGGAVVLQSAPTVSNTLAIRTGADANVFVSAAGNANLISLNGGVGIGGATMGLVGGQSGDNSLYFYTPDGFRLLSGNVSVADYGATTPDTWTFNQKTEIKGTDTNDGAPAGFVGEVTAGVVLSGSAVPMTSGAAVNIDTLSIPPGDWDIGGEVWVDGGAATTITSISAAIGTTSGTVPTAPSTSGAVHQLYGSFSGGGSAFTKVLPLSAMRLSIASTTTVYLVAKAAFSSTLAGYGVIHARRMR